MRILNELKKLPGFKLETLCYGSMFLGTCNGFRVRAYQDKNDEFDGVKPWRIELAIKKNFDRWANSCDFYFTESFHYNRKTDFKDAHRFCQSIVKSGLFKSYHIDIGMEVKSTPNKPLKIRKPREHSNKELSLSA